jgi:predicted RecA/RadA family phage recombinase
VKVEAHRPTLVPPSSVKPGDVVRDGDRFLMALTDEPGRFVDLEVLEGARLVTGETDADESEELPEGWSVELDDEGDVVIRFGDDCSCYIGRSAARAMRCPAACAAAAELYFEQNPEHDED